MSTRCCFPRQCKAEDENDDEDDRLPDCATSRSPREKRLSLSRSNLQDSTFKISRSRFELQGPLKITYQEERPRSQDDSVRRGQTSCQS
jgi:hypothetical protein